MRACAGVSFHNRAGGARPTQWIRSATVKLGEITRIGNANGCAHLSNSLDGSVYQAGNCQPEKGLQAERRPLDDSDAVPIAVSITFFNRRRQGHRKPLRPHALGNPCLGTQSDASCRSSLGWRDPSHANHFLFLPGVADTGSHNQWFACLPVRGNRQEVRWRRPIRTHQHALQWGLLHARRATRPMKSGLSSFATQAMPAS